MRQRVKSLFKKQQSPDFRADIAGLRGIAVLFVLFCHFEVPGFKGGFIGPDIFFVISGYLITGLLIKEYNRNISSSKLKAKNTGTISLRNFYLRRIRRILPAAVLVIIAINVWAVVNLNFLQVNQIKSDSIWTLLFGANITFLRQATDYFAQSNAQSPLQHYWSLSVEEQFYFVWPMLFLALTSFHNLNIKGRTIEWRQRLGLGFLVATVASLFWLLVEFTSSPTTAYFSTFSRAWELGLGALISLMAMPKFLEKHLPLVSRIRLLAFFLLVTSLLLVSPTNFGYILFIPVFSTALLIWTGKVSQNDLVSRLLSNKIFLGIGAISYSLYLWHWPVFVFAKQEGWMSTPAQHILGIVLCFALATLSYWFIERTFLAIPIKQKIKKRPSGNRKSFSHSKLLTSLSAVSIIFALAFVTYPTNFQSGGNSTQTQSDWIPPASAASYAPTVELSQSSNAEAFSFTFSNYITKWRKDVSEGLKTKAISNQLASNLSKLTNENSFLYCDGKYSVISKSQTRMCESNTPEGAHKTAVIFGDSHAAHLWPAISGALDHNHWKIYSLTLPACPYTEVPYNHFDENATCELHRNYVLNFINTQKPDLLVLSDGYGISKKISPTLASKAWKTLIGKLKIPSKNIEVINMTPFYDKIADCLRGLQITKCKKSFIDTSNGSHKFIQSTAKNLNLHLINLDQYICSFQGNRIANCPILISENLVALDSNHFTREFSELLSPFFANEFASDRFPFTKPFQDQIRTSQTGSGSSEKIQSGWAQKILSGQNTKRLTNDYVNQLAYARNDSDASLGWNCNRNGLPKPTTIGNSIFSVADCSRPGSPSSPKNALILGDSLATRFAATVGAALPATNWNVRVLSRTACMVAQVIPTENGVADMGCIKHRQWEFAQIKKLHPEILFITESSNHSMVSKSGMNEFDTWRTGFEKSISELSRYADNLVIIGDHPPLNYALQDCLSKQLEIATKCYGSAHALQNYRMTQQLIAKKHNAFYINPVPWLCTNGICPPIIGTHVVYKDKLHFTFPFARALAPLLQSELLINNLLK